MAKEYSSKENAVYEAVISLLEEGGDVNNLTVAEITKKAGIGKGTAYEYFSDKEEMIAKALFYNAEVFCKQIHKGLDKEKNLYGKVNYILLKMEQHVPKANCIFRFIYMMTDNSTISRRMKELVEEVLATKISAINIIKKVLEDEFQNRETPSDEKMEYLVLSIYSKILCYAMFLNRDKYAQEEERACLRSMVSEGICREIKEI